MRIGRMGRHALVLVALAATTGCRWIPARRPDMASANRAVSPSTLPPLPALRPISDREAFAPSTPILDAAAERQMAIHKIQAESTTTPAEIPEVAVVPVPPAGDGQVDHQVSPAHYEIIIPPPPTESVVVPVAAQEVKPINPPEPSQDPWLASLQQLRDLARQREQDGGPEATTWGNRERVLECLATDDDAPLWTPIAETLATPVSEPPVMEVVTAEPSQVVIVPDPSPTFAITDLRLCRKVLGFGRTEPIPSATLEPGRQVLLYCELDGLSDEIVDQAYHSRLAAEVEILKSSDESIVWRADLGEQQDRCDRRRRDFYANYRIQIPTDLPDGLYTIRLLLADRVGSQNASRALELRIAR